MTLRSKAVTLLSKETGLSKKVVDSLIETPPDPKMGDLSFPCFILSKKLKKSPGEISKQIREKLVVPKGFNKIEVAGPYLNIYFDIGDANKEILAAAMKKEYGQNQSKERVSLEGFNANPFKEVHVGHLRNGVLSLFLSRLFAFNGSNVYFVHYHGDVGSHVSKWLWYFDKFYKGKIPKNDISKWAGELYVKAVEKVEDNEEKYSLEVREVGQKLEARDPKISKQWKRIRSLCLKDIDRIAKEVGLNINHSVGESDVESVGKKTVLKNKRKLEDDDGVLLIDLEKKGLSKLLLLKSDGTGLYSTRDLGLMQLKQRKFKADKYLTVVGSEQDLYFKQLFKTFEVLKLPNWSKFEVVHNGFVTLKTGKMASRKGNVITYDQMKKELVKRASVEVRKRNAKISKRQLGQISSKIAIGALLFGLLKHNNNKTVVFDVNEALRFDGDTAPYLQYGLVRARKILSKSKTRPSVAVDFSLLISKSERELIKSIGSFPNIVAKATQQYQPSTVANYALELVRGFNRFYESNPVLSANIEERKARLLLVNSYEKVLSKCLYLLAVPEVKQM